MNNYTTKEQEWEVSLLELTEEQIKDGDRTWDCKPRSVPCSWEKLRMIFNNVLTPEISQITSAENLSQNDFKHFIPAFMNAKFKKGSSKHIGNVEEITIVGLDFDKCVYENLKKVVVANGWRSIIYTSYSHTKAAPRFRVVLFPNSPISEAEWEVTWESLNYLFDNTIDNVTKNLNRYFYFPSKPIGTDEGHFVEFIEGGLLDAKSLPKPPTAESALEAVKSPSRGLYEALVEEVSYEEFQEAAERFREEYRVRRLDENSNQDNTNSALEFSLVLWAVGRRVSFDCVRAWFDKDGGFEHYNKKKKGASGVRRAEAHLRRDYKKASRQPERPKRDKEEIRSIAPLVRSCIEHDCENWKSVKEGNIRRVLQSHITIIEELGNLTYSFPVREIAKKLDGLTAMSCSRHTNTLVERGWLKDVERRFVFGHGKTYTLGPRLREIWEICDSKRRELLHMYTQDENEPSPHLRIECNNLRQTEGIRATEVCGQSETYSVFTHRELGRVCEKIYLLVQPGPKTIQEIMNLTGRERRNIRDYIRRMEKWSIVTLIDGVVSLSPDLNLEALASNEALGTIDKKPLNIARYNREQDELKIKAEIGKVKQEERRKDNVHKWHLERQYQPSSEEEQFHAEQDRDREQYEADYVDYQTGLFNDDIKPV